MKNNVTTQHKAFKTAAIIAVVLALLICLVACNKETDEPRAEYSLHYSLMFDEASDSTVAWVTMSSAGGAKIEGVKAKRSAETHKDGEMWNDTVTEYEIPAASLYSVLSNTLTQEDMTFEGKQYPNLKIVFYYDTIYKSIESNAETSKIQSTYRHKLALSDEGNEILRLTRRTQNTASWYTILATGGLLLGATALGVYLWQNRVGKRTALESEK